MAIKGRIGLPGGGKSLSAVEEDIIPALKAGKRVYTNIPIRPDELAAMWDIQLHHLTVLDDEEMADLYVKRDALGESNPGEYGKTLWVHDEIQKVFPSGEWQKTPRVKAFRNVIAWHRHDEIEIVWISQHHSSVDAELRKRTKTFWRHDDVGVLGVPRLRNRLYLPNLAGEPEEPPLRTKWYKPDPRVFVSYKSFEVGTGAKTKDERPGLPRSVLFLGMLILIAVVAVGWMVYNQNPFAMSKAPGITSNPIPRITPPKTDSTKRTGTNEAKPTPPPKNQSYDGWICLGDRCDLYDGGDYSGTTDYASHRNALQVRPDLRRGKVQGNGPTMATGPF